MPTIRHISSLKNNIKEILKICQEENQPVFLTQHGKEALVVLSNHLYESLVRYKKDREDLYRLLEEAENDDRPPVKFEDALDYIDKAIENASV